MKQVLGVVGGTGLYEIAELQPIEQVEVQTPYGPPSDKLLRARAEDSDVEVVFLPRHGRGHRIPPHKINYRANICALKQLGVTQVLSVSAVGSLREDIAPGDLCVVDQFIDLTKRRVSTFFEEGVAAHVAFSDPVCPVMAAAIYDCARQVAAQAGDAGPGVHRGGTYVCIEGPQFSTRAESLIYRSWKVDLVGMTNMPEAKLAREAELPYATLALATDYDCWHESEDAVDVPSIVARLNRLTGHAKQIIARLCRSLPDVTRSPAVGALGHAVMTSEDDLPPATRKQLEWLLGV